MSLGVVKWCLLPLMSIVVGVVEADCVQVVPPSSWDTRIRDRIMLCGNLNGAYTSRPPYVSVVLSNASSHLVD